MIDPKLCSFHVAAGQIDTSPPESSPLRIMNPKIFFKEAERCTEPKSVFRINAPHLYTHPRILGQLCRRKAPHHAILAETPNRGSILITPMILQQIFR